MKSSRRSFAAVAGASVLGVASLRTLSVAAQSESPFTLGDGSVLTWSDPWTLRESGVIDGLGEFAMLISGQATLAVGNLSAPMTTDNVLNAMGIVATPVSGGESQTMDANGVVVSEVEHLLSVWKDGFDQVFSVLIQIADGVKATSLFAPVEEFAATVESVQAAVALDGVPVLDGFGRDDIQTDLDAGVEMLASGQEPAVAAAQAGIGGEYTDGTGNMHVTWTEGWTIISFNLEGIELQNPEQTVILNMQVSAFDGLGWEEVAQSYMDWLAGDQGPDATMTSHIVTPTGFSFATDGEYGLRLIQGVATADDLDHYISIFTSNMFAEGADAVAILAQIQADIRVNGEAPLQGMEAFIDMSGS